MPVRMTGMASGLDTETLIKGMMDAQRMKNKKVSDKSQILEWKQERLKEVNAKLYKLYAEDLTKLKMQGAYNTKKVSSSNENVVSITGDSNAPTGASTISVTSTAVSQSVIGGVLGNAVTGTTKLSSLVTGGFTVGSDIVITNGTRETGISITKDTTINDLVTQLKGAGLNANFDTIQKRIFISSPKSGTENNFSIKQYGTGTVSERNNIKNIVGYSSMSDTEKNKVISALNILSNSSSTADSIDSAKTELTKLAENKVESAQMKSANAEALNLVIKEISKNLIDSNKISTKFNAEFSDEEGFKSSDAYKVLRKDLISELKYNSDTITEEQEGILLSKAIERYKQNLVSYDDIYTKEYNKNAEVIREKIANNEITDLNGLSEDDYIASKIKETADNSFNSLSSANKIKYFNNVVSAEFNSEELINGPDIKTKAQAYMEQVASERNLIYNKAEFVSERDENTKAISLGIQNYINNNSGATSTQDVLSLLKLGEVDGNTTNSTTTNGMKFIKAENAVINYNGIDITSNSNVINVNGLTITVKGVTSVGEKVTINTTNDTQATVDSVKKFITNYNAILKEMNELYYAGSARDYAPLSDDERESMTDSQIEKWEKKIKDSMLRRDSNISNVLIGMKQAVMTTVKASDGKTYSLASLGIGTSSDYTEKGLLHLDGNPDEIAYSMKTNKLMNMLESDPDIVAEILSKTMDTLYKDIDSKIRAIPNVRSAFTFYNDKTMNTQQTTYKKKISELEKKLTTLETKYYKQFAAMEKAMANLQSQSNSLTSMLGGSSK